MTVRSFEPGEHALFPGNGKGYGKGTKDAKAPNMPERWI